MTGRVVLTAAGLGMLLVGCGQHAASTPVRPPVAASSTPSAVTSAPPRTSSPPGSVSEACTAGQLRIAPFVEATPQDAFVTLTVTDVGAACVLDGAFDAAGYDGGALVFRAAAHGAPASTVRLAPAQHLTLQVTFVATSGCPTIDALRVTPPAQSAAVAVPLGRRLHACPGATIGAPQGP